MCLLRQHLFLGFQPTNSCQELAEPKHVFRPSFFFSILRTRKSEPRFGQMYTFTFIVFFLGVSLPPRECCSTAGNLSYQFDTGWSKETVDCNFLLTDTKPPKIVTTQLFLDSLYREVLVFWCFKGFRWVEFCLLKHFQYRAFAAPYKAWTLQNTLKHIQTP